MSTAALELIIRLKDQASKELAGLAERVREVGAAAKEVEAKTGGLGAGIGGLAGPAKVAAVALAAVGVAAVGIGTAMVKGNAEFERYQVQFGVLLGSATAAKQRLEELAAFGASTPFELPEVVRADKVLQAFGIHSQELLTTVGDVASGAGASFEEMANLIGKFSAGATGEAISRFQELGITTRKEMAEMGLKFSKAGELLSPLPEAMTVVTKIMKDRFGGMMAAQSTTFEGMLSNLQDWVGQATRTLGAPLFDVVKAQLGELLAYLNEPATKATLASMAQGLADGIKVAVPMIVTGLKVVATTFSPMISVIGPIAKFVADNFIPAIAGAGAALAAFAAVTLTAAIPSESALLLIIMQTIPAMIAQAAAAAAAVAPFALIAVAVYGMAKAWQNYSEKHDAALDKLLESRKWWTDAEKALADYNNQAGYVKDATKTQADALQQLTEAQKADLDSLAKRMELGLVSGAQYQEEMAAINARIPAINAARAALEHETEALSENSLRATDAIENARLTQTAHQDMGAQMGMTAEQAKTLADALAKISTAGTAALASLIPTTANFLSSLSTAAADHSAKIATIVSESNTQFGQIAAARAKIFSNSGKTFGKIKSDLGKKLSDIARNTGGKLADIEHATGSKLADIAKGAQAKLADIAKQLGSKLADIAKATGEKLADIDSDLGGKLAGIAKSTNAKLADIAKQLGGKLGDINAASSEKIADINKALGSKLGDIAKSAGAKIADINKATGAKIADINKQAAERLAAIDKKAIDERAAAYVALQKAIATSMADMVAAQEANDLDLAGASGDRLAELRRRESTEAASRERLAAAAIEAQQRAAKGEAAIAGQVYAIRQDGIGKQASLDEAYAKRREELANDPAALAELRRQYDEATAALQAAEQQRITIVEAEQREKEAQREQEKAEVRAAQAEQIAAAKAAAAEQIAATRQAAIEQIAAAKAAAAEQRQATLEAAAKQRADAIQQAAEARQQAVADAAEKRAAALADAAAARQAALKQAADQKADALAAAAEQRAATQQQAAEARQAALQQAAEQKAAALQQAAEQRAAAQEQAAEQRSAAAAQLAEQIRGNNEQAAVANQARAEKLAAENAAYAREQQLAAEAYAKQAAEQREHLGVMLIDRVNAMAAAGLVTKEQAAAMTASLKTEYGIAETNAALTFGKMSATLDAWATNGGKNADLYTGKLHGIETQSVATQVKLDAMAKEYEIKILEDFNAKRLNAEQYADALARIPAQVRTQLELEMVAKLAPIFAPGPRRNGGEVGDDNVAAPKLPRRAMGGPVTAGQAYIVGEKRPEVFIPKQSGTIIPNLDRFTTMPVGDREQIPEPRGGGGRYRANPGAIRVDAPITINMPPGGGAGGVDGGALLTALEGRVDDIISLAIERVIARDL